MLHPDHLPLLSAGVPPPTPIIPDTPAKAVAIPSNSCPFSSSYDIPANSEYQRTTLTPSCGSGDTSPSGFYYSIGPFTSMSRVGFNTYVYSTVNAGTSCTEGSDTDMALYRVDSGTGALTCLAYNNNVDITKCSEILYTVTAADVLSGQRFLLRVGLDETGLTTAQKFFRQHVQVNAFTINACTAVQSTVASSSTPRSIS
jgi:hypothetical protein